MTKGLRLEVESKMNKDTLFSLSYLKIVQLGTLGARTEILETNSLLFLVETKTPKGHFKIN